MRVLINGDSRLTSPRLFNFTVFYPFLAFLGGKRGLGRPAMHRKEQPLFWLADHSTASEQRIAKQFQSVK